MSTATTTRRPKVQVSRESRPVVPKVPVVVCAVPEIGEGVELIRAGAELAASLGGTLMLVHARPVPLIAAEPQIAFASPQPDAASELQEAARELARVAAGSGAGGETRIHTASGHAERSLVEIAEREAAALIVVGSRGYSRSLLDRAPCPVLVIRDELVRDGPPVLPDWGERPMAGHVRSSEIAVMPPKRHVEATRSVLCGVDGSTGARVALRAAAQLSAQLDARLVVAHVVPMSAQASRLGPKTMLSTGAALEAAGEMLERVLDEEGLADVEQRVDYGFPADRLADLADEEDAELIVVGSRGRGALKAAFLGSVSTDLIGIARRPVLVVPPAVDAADGGAAGDERRLGDAAVH